MGGGDRCGRRTDGFLSCIFLLFLWGGWGGVVGMGCDATDFFGGF